MSDLAAAQARLEAADAAVAEHARLQQRIEQARGELEPARAASIAAWEKLSAETEDVERLESYSPTRIWASLRGERDADLQREEAERQQAEYLAAAARAEVDRVQDELRTATEAQQALGDVRAERERALAAKTALVVEAGGDGGAELAEVSDQLARLRARSAQLAEADVAGNGVATALRSAIDLLDRAGDWATVDTFAGGGAFTDSMKYRRMDEATAVLTRCQDKLSRFGRELAHVAVTGVPVSVSTSQQFFDVWSDDLFSDWTVRKRVRDAQKGATAALAQVEEVRGRLAVTRSEVDAEVRRLVARREELLA